MIYWICVGFFLVFFCLVLIGVMLFRIYVMDLRLAREKAFRKKKIENLMMDDFVRVVNVCHCRTEEFEVEIRGDVDGSPYWEWSVWLIDLPQYRVSGNARCVFPVHALDTLKNAMEILKKTL